jgi:hypothetical protein
MSRLTVAGLPVPSTQRAQTWQQAVVAAQRRPVVVKREAADVGRGAHVALAVDGMLVPDAPFPGPYIVQDHIQTDASVYKLYIAGTHVRGLLKPNLRAQRDTEKVTPFDVEKTWRSWQFAPVTRLGWISLASTCSLETTDQC